MVGFRFRVSLMVIVNIAIIFICLQVAGVRGIAILIKTKEVKLLNKRMRRKKILVMSLSNVRKMQMKFI